MSNIPAQQPPRQKQIIKLCVKCKNKIESIFSTSEIYCWDCRVLFREQVKKQEKAMRESYCPFCHMLLAEHKQNEAQLCLYNLRGYVKDLIT